MFVSLVLLIAQKTHAHAGYNTAPFIGITSKNKIIFRHVIIISFR